MPPFYDSSQYQSNGVDDDSDLLDLIGGGDSTFPQDALRRPDILMQFVPPPLIFDDHDDTIDGYGSDHGDTVEQRHISPAAGAPYRTILARADDHHRDVESTKYTSRHKTRSNIFVLLACFAVLAVFAVPAALSYHNAMQQRRQHTQDETTEMRKHNDLGRLVAFSLSSHDERQLPADEGEFNRVGNELASDEQSELFSTGPSSRNREENQRQGKSLRSGR